MKEMMLAHINYALYRLFCTLNNFLIDLTFVYHTLALPEKLVG